MKTINNLQLTINKRGFTLIELLIVVVIIGVLATLLMTNFIGIRERARDSQRKGDLRAIQSALELYRADQGNYPDSGAAAGNFPTSCGIASSLTNSDSTIIYMQKIPCDSLGGTYWNSGTYYYALNVNTYTIGSCIENKNDTDQNVTGTDPSGGSVTPACSTGKYFVLNNP